MASLNDNNNNSFETIEKSRVSKWLRWRQTSALELDNSEKRVLSFLKSPYKGYYVDIGEGWGLDNNRVWTLEMEPSEQSQSGTPLVLLHGFASAVGLWCLNLDSFSNTNRRLYAIDILGFGKSSRPKFDHSEAAELELVDSIERWRNRVGLNEKFIILGHSFGGYLALSYALHYPDNVKHVILADPWGMPSHTQQLRNHNFQIPIWAKMVGTVLFQTFTPLAGLRAAGPWGPKLIEKLRPDLKKKFERITGAENADSVLNYIYHCNAQSYPSGEMAFKSIAMPLGWARYPMINRVSDLHPNISLSFIYGSRSWIDRQPGFQIKYLLGDYRVNVHVINGSGHHVYADKPDEFNDIVTNICGKIDTQHLAAQNDYDYENDDSPVEALID